MKHPRSASPEGSEPLKRARPASLATFFVDSESSGESDDDILQVLFPETPRSQLDTVLRVPDPQGDLDVQAALDAGYHSDMSTASSRDTLRSCFPDAEISAGERVEDGLEDGKPSHPVEIHDIMYPTWNRTWKNDLETFKLHGLNGVLDVCAPPRYALSAIPFGDVEWDGKLLSNGNDVCDIRVVGVLEDATFTASRHSIFQRSSVTVYLLRDIDQRSLAKVHHLARPIQRASSQRLRAVYQPPPNCGDVFFPHVYDATRGYTSKATMPKVPVSCLQIGDIVVIEGLFIRVKLGAAPGWDRWTTEFRMSSIARVYARPR